MEHSSTPEVNRLRWRCRRGMRELDTLLVAFLERGYCSASTSTRAGFDALLSLPDPEILDLLTRRKRSDDESVNRVIGEILAQPVP